MVLDVVNIIYVVIYFIFGVVFLWEVNLTMIRKKKMLEFLPMFLIGFLIIFQGIFIFYNWFLYVAWGVLEVLFILSYLWIFVNLWREDGNRK